MPILFDSIGYIDLSKRRVSATDIAKCEERYNKSKAVHSIMSTVAKKENKDLEALYSELAWPLYAKYGHAYDAFKAALKYVSTLGAHRYPLKVKLSPRLLWIGNKSATLLIAIVGFAF